LFMASHFEAHHGRVLQRNAHYHRIDTQMLLPPGFRSKLIRRYNSEDQQNGYESIPGDDPRCRVTRRFDRVFWMGDFNYRINESRDEVIANIESGTREGHDNLLSKDQLLCEKAQGRVFSGMTEGPLNFAPTYKFDKNVNRYDTSKKKRIPAWTDRILHRSPQSNMIHQLEYTSVPGVMFSDHRPVVAKYGVSIQGVDDPTLIGVHTEELGHAASQVCSIM